MPGPSTRASSEPLGGATVAPQSADGGKGLTDAMARNTATAVVRDVLSAAAVLVLGRLLTTTGQIEGG